MALPEPRTWSDGEEPENIPHADDLNLDWKDSFDFLLGVTKPIGLFRTNASQAISSTFVNINLPVESLKRGGLTHSTVSNTHLVTVPYTGQYQGFASCDFVFASATGLRMYVRILVNGVETASFNAPNIQTVNTTVSGTFTLDLQAGDTVNISQGLSSGTATSGSTGVNAGKLGIWWAGGDPA